MAEKVSHVTVGDRLSNRNLWTFSAGGVGRDMAYALWNSFLLVCIMYTKGVTNAQLSIILIMMAVCRIWDAINDPIMGGIIERTRTKWGKFKPWIFAGAISNALVTFMIFAIPLRGQDFLIFFPFGYLLWDITYTMNDIGYWAMMPSLTSNDEDRNKISMLANIFAGIGGGIAGIIVPIFTTGQFAIGDSAVTGFTVMAAVIGLIFIGCQIMTCCSVKEKALPPVQEKIGVKQMFNVIFKNDQLLWIALVMILYNLGSSLYFASTTNFLYFRFGYKGAMVAIFGTLGGILGAVTIFYPLLAKKFTRRTISIGGIIVAVIGYVMMFILGSATMSNANINGVFIGLILCATLICMGQTMFYMVITVSVANTIEYNEWKTGKRDEAIIFSVRPFMSKMGSALVVVFQAIIYGILGVGTYTKDISDLENLATNIIANNIKTGADYNKLIEASGTTFEGVESALIGKNAPHAFADVVGELKASGIQNIIDGVNDNIKIWMLFGLTIIPVIFIVVSLIVWCKKYKINEQFYCEIVTENLNRKGEDITSGDILPEVTGAIITDASSMALGAEVPEIIVSDDGDQAVYKDENDFLDDENS